MSPEEQKFFDAARDLFLSEGWKAFHEELQLMIDGQSIESCNSEPEFWLAKGRLQAFRQVQGYENAVRLAEEQYDA